MHLDPYRAYRGTLLSPDEVRELSRLRPARVVVSTLHSWAWILAAWGLVAAWPSWWTVLVAIPVIGTRYYALFILGHDGLHRRLFPSHPTNDLYCDLLLLGPLAAVTRINCRNHLEHHRLLANDSDPDRHKYGAYNKRTRTHYLAFLSGTLSLGRVARNFFTRAEEPPRDEASSRAPRGYTPRDLVIIAGWQVITLGGLTWAVAWWAYPVLWLLPLYLFTYLGDLTRSFLEHAQPEADDDGDAHRLITHLSHPLERLLFAPSNMNYHTAHHLWPSIPYYNLPEADRLMRSRPDGAQGLEWRRSYLGSLWRYYSALPLTWAESPSRSVPQA